MNRLKKLKKMVKRLRYKKQGCSWCKEQSWQSLAPSTIEETHELVEAIHENDVQSVKDELGDLLYHILFYAQIAEEKKLFRLKDVLNACINKSKRRNPQVFGKKQRLNLAETVEQWEKIKHEERKTKNSLLDKIPASLPALIRAHKLQERASKVGFDWQTIDPVFEKFDEEIMELKEEKNSKKAIQNLEEELGDMLFSCVNIARHLAIDPEVALQQVNNKFYKRFRTIEETAKKQGKDIAEMSLEEMDLLWEKAKLK